MTFSVTILGSSSALPTTSRFPSAQLLTAGERFFLFDCGEGTQIQLRRFKINFSRINHIFISHLHGDHFYGLPGLISSFSLLHRKHDLHIYAFPELQDMIDNLFKYQKNEMSFKLIYHPLSNNNEVQQIYEDNQITVKSFPLKHSIATCGFLVEEKQRLRNLIKEKILKYKLSVKEILQARAGYDVQTEQGENIPIDEIAYPPFLSRKYVYCSDTAYSEKIVPLIKDVDLLYHEATFLKENESNAKETLHSTAEHAAKIAKLANVKKLVIGHFSSRYKTEELFLSEARAIFEETYLANEGAIFEIPAIRGK